MKKFFDLTTLLIVVGISVLGYMGYNKFYLKKNEADNERLSQIINENERAPKIVKVDESMVGKRGEDIFSPDENSSPLSEPEVSISENGIKVISNGNEKEVGEPEIKPITEKTETPPAPGSTQPPIEEEVEPVVPVVPAIPIIPVLPPIEDDRSPKDPTIPIEKLTPEEKETIIEDPIVATPGFYENKTYDYSLSYPTNWPIKIRKEENISIGTIPPKNGQGAITVEIAANMDNEIAQAKEEAQRYPGIITIKETPIIIGGSAGTKMTLYNATNNLTDVYIYLQKYGLYYAIKYSEESVSFVKDVEQALTTFKFTK